MECIKNVVRRAENGTRHLSRHVVIIKFNQGTDQTSNTRSGRIYSPVFIIKDAQGDFLIHPDIYDDEYSPAEPFFQG